MDTTRSADGTTIAFDRHGSGTPVVFVSGAFNDRNTCAPVARAFGDGYTVVTYDRRGRGDSTETAPYAVEREIEDLEAVIAEEVTTFQLEGIGLPAEMVAQIQQSPFWPYLEALAPTVVYDATISGEPYRPTPAMANHAVPVLVLNAAETWPRLKHNARALPGYLANATHLELDGGHNHEIPAAATAAAVKQFIGH